MKKLRYFYFSADISSANNSKIVYNKKSFLMNFLCILFLTSIAASCKKFTEVGAPITSTNARNVYTADATAAAVLTGIYTNMNLPSFDNGITSLSLYPSLSADELSLFNSNNQTILYKTYYSNALTANIVGGVSDYWNNFYSIIYVANSAIEGLTNNSTLSPNVRDQLLGEAKFIRAFSYFYLTNLYGDVPLATTTNFETNRLLPRTNVDKVHELIINDLNQSINLLNSNYLYADRNRIYSANSAERIFPNKWTAKALLAREYLYRKLYSDAERESSEILNNKQLYDTTSVANAFLKNTREAIWQLQPVVSGINTQEARIFILPTSGPNITSYPVFLNPSLVKDFDNNDRRKSNWINSVTVGSTIFYYPYKYKVASGSTVNEYAMVFRIGEQYLIRAEARAQLNKIAEAKSDINVIRQRAGLEATTANDQTSLLSAVANERRFELFTEWGHRWLDLKRTNTVNAIMSIVTPQKGGTWNPNLALYPIPARELSTNPNLSSQQNPGY